LLIENLLYELDYERNFQQNILFEFREKILAIFKNQFKADLIDCNTKAFYTSNIEKNDHQEFEKLRMHQKKSH